jgi:hypothetical protein
MITRNSYIKQGYMCPDFHREECIINVARSWGNSHGNHGNEWWYELKTPGEGGMHFQVYTCEKPDCVPEDRWSAWDFKSGRDDDGCMFVNLIYHCPWILDRDGILSPSVVKECDLAEPCRATREVRERSPSGAALWALFDRKNFVQSEAFWLQFEAILKDQIVCAKVERAECGDLGIQKCDKCHGEGVTPK